MEIAPDTKHAKPTMLNSPAVSNSLSVSAPSQEKPSGQCANFCRPFKTPTNALPIGQLL